MSLAPFRIVTVCTGNICRSPLGEALLRQELTLPDFEIASAGIMAVIGAHVPRPQMRIAKGLGVSGLEAHKPQLVTEEFVENADLILGMSRGHRKRVVRLDPQAVRKTFTIREFARLAPLVTPNDVREFMEPGVSALAAAVEAVGSKRGLLPPPKFVEEFDVIDPYKQGRSVYKLSRDELVPAVEVTSAFFKSIASMFPQAEDKGGAGLRVVVRNRAQGIEAAKLEEAVAAASRVPVKVRTGQTIATLTPVSLDSLPRRSSIHRIIKDDGASGSDTEKAHSIPKWSDLTREGA